MIEIMLISLLLLDKSNSLEELLLFKLWVSIELYLLVKFISCKSELGVLIEECTIWLFKSNSSGEFMTWEALSEE